MKALNFILCAAAIGALGMVTPASAHTTVVLVPGQMIGGGYISTAHGGATPDPRSPDGTATDGTLVISNLDPDAKKLQVRKCTNDACSAFQRHPVTNQVIVVEHQVASTSDATPGVQSEVALTSGFSSHVGRYRVNTLTESPSFGVFRVTGSE